MITPEPESKPSTPSTTPLPDPIHEKAESPAHAAVETQNGPDLPDWYPGWVRELADRFYSGTSCLYVVHGNVRDLMRGPKDDDGTEYYDLIDFLSTKVFGAWDLVLGYDLAQGLRPLAGEDARREKAMTQELTDLLADPKKLSRDPSVLLPALDTLVENVLTETRANKPRRTVFLFDYAQYLTPAGDLESLSPAQEANLIRFLAWAQNPYIKRVNMVFVLVADKLSEVNERLLQNPHVTTLQVPLPDRSQRKAYLESTAATTDLAKVTDFGVEQLADLTNGLTLFSLRVLLTQGQQAGKRVDNQRFRALKKAMIEQQCQGLLEFIEPTFKLDMLVGLDAAKDRLREDAHLLERGELEALPMGYLICGPVGTGKTFLAECFAGEIGIPVVKLKNFRSKYVGETEGNLESVLGVLRSLGPVIVVIDEADAALGTRQAGGDSGTSSRVFGMIASQMGDTRYRGKILWMLLTSRPDFLPIDLKRQGRAEVHIPLFYPKTEAEIRTMLETMARKNKVTLARDAIPPVDASRNLSGSDLESILLAAQRRTLTAGRREIQREDLQHALETFLPSAQGLEKEAQELAAVLECTDMQFLPDHWREKLKQPNGRTQLQERHVAIKQLLKEF